MLRVREGLEQVRPFIDDIVCFSKNGEQQVRDLRRSLERLTRFDLKLARHYYYRRGRNHLPRPKISSEGVDPDPDKAKAIEEMSMPQNVSQMRSLLGGQPLKHGHSAPCYEKESNSSSHPTTSASSKKY